ncbi:haloacid dehalogenase-like hydrolase domain-containing protein 2 isoform X2 [Phlebotomus argentipes]|uniref:haloacid dehalogenase-like hydrolase domain-containing protein 2 isoform X2 n=1 Tax=Phlebotomus argentipes TaxID=94469 RepID=UPI002892FD28|nr:haloacid dehalogenase-like hydrolase domain-containing protein 2 isoform X2 [Phlebotomus argentipes]
MFLSLKNLPSLIVNKISITTAQKMSPISAVLIDLSGTLHVEDDPTENAVEALKKFVTNTTKESGQTLHRRLVRIGFELDPEEIYSSLSAASDYVKKNQLNPLYLLSQDAQKDFPPVDKEKLDSVVVGLAPEEFHYEQLNRAFNLLRPGVGKPLIAIHEGRYYKRSDGLALGPGCFVKGLEFAASTEAVVVGKPNKYFFQSAIPENLPPEECVMIGDDAVDDIQGAMSLGMRGLLVKTGKYLPDTKCEPKPTATLDNFSSAVNWIETSLKSL